MYCSSDGKESACNVRDPRSIPGSRRFPGWRERLPTPVFLPGKSHGQRSLAGYSPWGRKGSDTTERLTLFFTFYGSWLAPYIVRSKRCWQLKEWTCHASTPRLIYDLLGCYPVKRLEWGQNGEDQSVSSVAQSCPTLGDPRNRSSRPPCPSPTPGVHSDSRPSSQWCHPAISSSVVPYSSCPQSLPASESFPMSQLLYNGPKNLELPDVNASQNLAEENR